VLTVPLQDAPYEPVDRRPIASRSSWLWQRVAMQLAAAGVPANGISIGGMGVAIVGGVLLALTPRAGGWDRAYFAVAAVAAQLRLLANLLDGMVAIAAGRASAMGELYNELPDRPSDFALLAGAGYAVGGSVALGFSAAAVAIATAYVRAVGKSMGAAGLFHGPMAKPHRMAVLTVAAAYMAVAPAGWRVTWHGYGVMAAASAVVVIGGLVTCGRRIARIAAHLRGGKP
jgi:phosphatidylglycerophosphate synthase